MNSLKKPINLVAIILFAIAFISSCKEKEDEADTTKPVITVVEPMAGDTVDGEIHIEFTATDNGGLKQVSGTIKDLNGKEIFSKTEAATDLKTYSFHQHHEPTGFGVIKFNVTVTAMDKSNNIETRTIPVYYSN